MGLFVRGDGHYQGWLAALLCCWTSTGNDEHSPEKRNIPPPTAFRHAVCHDQPTPLPPLPLAATRDVFDGGVEAEAAAAFDKHGRARAISERPPSLKPLDLGEPSLLDRATLHSRQKSSTTLMSRISIGKPMDFRRLDYTEKQRKSLVPLQLGPVVLKRDSAFDPDNSSRPISVRSTDCYLTNSAHGSSRDSRGTPFDICQSRSSSSPTLVVGGSPGPIVETPKEMKPVRPALSTQSSSSSMRSLRRSAGDVRVSTGSGSSRNSFEKTRLKRKRSGVKIGESADIDVDREILELNTIVEERRAEARPQSPATRHIPAVAPQMSVRARSETLNDIGSAFSRPLVPSMPSATPSSPIAELTTTDGSSSGSPINCRLSRPFDSMPDVSVVEQSTSQQHIRRPSSGVTGWLSTMFSTSATMPTDSRTQEHRQTCEPSVRHRAVSETSLCTTWSNMDSNVFTSSSPISKRSRSRSLTAESRIMTPISCPSTVDEAMEPEPKSRFGEYWPPMVDHSSQVGVAL